MKIVGFTCCVDYADILKIVYPINKEFLDDYIVVTSSDDIETQNFCNSNGIKYIVSDSYKENGAKFNKASMLNKALKIIYGDKKYEDYWKLSLDADIAIDSTNFNKNMILNEKWMYGIERRLIYEIPVSPIPLCTLKVLPSILEKNVVVVQNVPELGFFQMYFKNVYFNEVYKDASFYDINFFKTYFTKATSFIFSENEITSYHIGDIGQNWHGCKEVIDAYGHKISTYKCCAKEGETIVLDSLSHVAYGTPKSCNFIYNQTGIITFNNRNFGDPFPYKLKSGFYKISSEKVNEIKLGEVYPLSISGAVTKFRATNHTSRLIIDKFKNIEYEPYLTTILLSLIKKHGYNNFVDVGSCIGYYSCLIGRVFNDKGKILSIECNPEFVHDQKDNLSVNNLSNVEVLQIALSDKIEKVYSKERSLFTKIGTPINEIAYPVKTYELTTTTFDDAVRGIDINLDIIKLDVHGYERKVLLGLSSSYKRVNTILLELHPEEYFNAYDTNGTNVTVLEILKDMGFTLWYVEGHRRNSIGTPSLSLIDSLQQFITSINNKNSKLSSISSGCDLIVASRLKKEDVI